MSVPLISCVVFFLSFNILSLQVILATLLTTIHLSPFLAVCFAFLGLTLSSVYVYIKSPENNGEIKEQELINALFHLAILLLICPVVIKYLLLSQHLNKELFAFNSPALDFLKILVGSSVSIGLIFSLVFLFLGKWYALIYKYYSHEAPRVYFFDLAGAALGCIFPCIAFNFLQWSSLFILLSLLALLFAIFFVCYSKGRKFTKIKIAVSLLICLLCFWFNIRTDALEVGLGRYGWLGSAPGESKKDTYREVWHKWNIYSKTSLYKTDDTDNKYKKYQISIKGGTAGVYPFEPDIPCQNKIFNKVSPLLLSFLFNKPKDILILFAGAGRDMVAADNYSCGSADITGVELNPLIVEKAMDLPGYNLRAFFAKKNIHMVIAEGRSYVDSIDKKFDAIILAYSGATALQYLGIDSFTAQYLYTKEAFKSYLQHLKPNGTIGVSGGDKIKVVATVKAALEERGYDNIAQKMVLFSSPITSQGFIQKSKDIRASPRLLIKNSNFTKEEVAQIQQSISTLNEEWVYNPSYTHPAFKVFEDILKNQDLKRSFKNAPHQRPKYEVLTDDMPFISSTLSTQPFFTMSFWHDLLSITWLKKNNSKLPDMINFSMSSFVVFLLFLGVLLITFPLMTKTNSGSVIQRLGFLNYFATIGVGFTFVEVAIMHAFTLLLGNPVYAFSLVLLSLLLSAGIGSFLSDYLFKRKYLNITGLSFLTFAVFVLNFLFISKINHYCLPLDFFFRVIIALALITPTGICLGMFFPQGLRKLFYYQKNLIPWVWGINGYMGIVGSALSICLSRMLGFSSLMLVAAFLYLLVAVWDKMVDIKKTS